MRLRITRLNALLFVISFFVVIYAEWYYPAKAFDDCVWPLGPSAKRIALIADPQIVDGNTYPGRNAFFMKVTEFVTDRFLARNFRMLHQRMRPDAVFFLGDLFDGGREWEDKPWVAELERFRRVFPPSKKVSHFLNLPGNHDVGSAEDIIPSAFERFRKVFGEPNQVQSIGGHSIVTLDTNALMNTKQESVYKPAKDFFEKLKTNQAEYDPIILLSHVPLFRPKGSYCGFEREGKPLDWKQGPQYITEVGPGLTQDIMYSLKPAFVFSGDDHDMCKYTHRWALTESTEEYTIKSFSMAMGIMRPGFQLLSVDTRKRHATESCLLAKPFQPIFIQVGAYSLLAILLAASVARPIRTKSYNALPVSEDKKKNMPLREQNARSKDFSAGIASMGGAWLLGQFIIHLWSYSSHL